MMIKQDLRVLFFCAVHAARIIIAHSTTLWFEKRGVAALLTMRRFRGPHPEEHRVAIRLEG
jgi:hypothetical protein